MNKKFVFIQVLTGCIGICPAAFTQNIGIGISTPAYKLDVKGHINISKDSVYRINKEPVLSSVGFQNIFAGAFAGFKNSGSLDNGFQNTMMGYYAGYENYNGKDNAYFGVSSGREAISANNNAFFGALTGFHNTGSNNTFAGAFSGNHNTTGNYNTFVGIQSGIDNTAGSYNTCIGAGSGDNNTTGDYNTYIGYNARSGSTNLTNATAIGYNAQVTASNQVRVGNSNVTSIGGYASWSNLSDGRFKVNVQEDIQGLAFIKRLRPVTYQLDLGKLDRHLQVDRDSLSSTPAFRSARTAKEQEIYSGFIAQEVEQAAQVLGFHFSGVDRPQNEQDTYKLRYAEFTVPLVKAVQELAAENDLLKKELAELKKLVQQLVTSD